ncbi:tetratricopeptide repeat protein [Yeosuana sp. MJ-SS3]|uniref:Tetratricopeptide repeat protein n=1 Tax=Gilvirhabdus luticola TaxID=3079858 RepID=A0ABU3U7E8_9FLAO|nr:tetratricopeptide repeat protein [Yeosuana sp. MJ-SS3]MDU8886329.1 tetratricopeptide repeat protein [Yeosuana sp. MJ-SS3]
MSNLNAQQNKDSSNYYYNLIIKPNTSSDLTDAYIFFEEHKKQSLLKNDTLRAILDLRYMAVIQSKLGSPYDSENSVIQALNYLDGLHGADTLIEPRIGLYNQLGIIYRDFKDYAKALNYYNKVLNVAIDSMHIVNVLNNKANVYREQQKFDLAIQELRKVKNYFINKKDTLNAGRALDNLGFVQSKNNDPEALINLEKGLLFRTKVEHVIGILTSYIHIAEHYKKTGNKVEALNYSNKALELARLNHDSKSIEQALSIIIDLDGNEELQEYKKILDSIALDKQLQENKYAASKYEYNEYVKKAQQSELEKELQKRKTIIAQGVLLLLFIVAIFLYFLLKSRHKKQTLEQVYHTETRISKKVHDEVANDVYQVMNKLQSTNKNNDEVLDHLEHIYERTRDISRENQFIDLTQNFKENLSDMLLAYNDQNVNVITKGFQSIDWESISDLKKTAIYRVLQELMTNMKKHSQASVVVLTFKKTGSNIYINYSDNGVGTTLKKQNGLQNTENRIQSLKGTITFETKLNNGFKAMIKI